MLLAARTTSRSVPMVTMRVEPATDRFSNSWVIDLVFPSMLLVESKQNNRSWRALSDKTQRRACLFIRLGRAAR